MTDEEFEIYKASDLEIKWAVSLKKDTIVTIADADFYVCVIGNKPRLVHTKTLQGYVLLNTHESITEKIYECKR